MENGNLGNPLPARLSLKLCSRGGEHGSLPSKNIHSSEGEEGENKCIYTCKYKEINRSTAKQSHRIISNHVRIIKKIKWGWEESDHWIDQ